MDASHSSKKIHKLKSVRGSVSPIDTRLTADSSLIRYLRGGSPITSSGGNSKCTDGLSSSEISSISSGGSNRSFGRTLSPLSSIENVISPPVYGTPMKVVDEDVLVIDDILVESLLGGRVSRSISSDSGGSSSNSASSPVIRVYKTELCRSWEDFGQCRYGSKCQFAHGKEELRPFCFPMKSKSETHSFKSYTHGSSSASYGSKSRFLPPVTTEAAVVANTTVISSRPAYKSQSPAVAAKSEYSGKNIGPMHLSKTLINPEVHERSSIGNIASQDWSPLDDGIEVCLAGNVDISSKKDVDAYLCNVLYGPSPRRRLPVFTEFCSQ